MTGSGTYTGDVEVGGAADVRELPGLKISKLAVSEMANNVYLLRDTATGLWARRKPPLAAACFRLLRRPADHATALRGR